MRTKEEIEVIILALHHRRNDYDPDFKRALVQGAIDALSWAVDEGSNTDGIFARFAELELKRLKPKKQLRKLARAADHFAI